MIPKNKDNNHTIQRNRRMDILKIFAIVLVIIGHFGGVPGWGYMENIFNIYGYHMALFLFISGYLFRDISLNDYPKFIWRKTKNLALPLLGWNFIYACIITIFNKFNIVEYLPKENVFSFYSLVEAPFLHGHQYILNLATWFVGLLFISLVVYGALHLLRKYIPEWIGLILLFIIGVVDLWLIKTYGTLNSEIIRALYRIPYALFFVHLGRCYRLYIERVAEKISAIVWLIILFVCQYELFRIVGNTAYTLVWLTFNEYIFAPYFAGIIGILIWVQVARIIEKWIPSNRLEVILSQSTWSIMTHHLLVRVLLCYALVQCGYGDLYAFRTDVWYHIYGWFGLLFFGCMFLPVIWQVYFDRIKSLCYNKLSVFLEFHAPPRLRR